MIGTYLVKVVCISRVDLPYVPLPPPPPPLGEAGERGRARGRRGGVLSPENDTQSCAI